MRRPRPRKLGGIFLRLHERDRIGADVGLAARPFDRLGQIGRHGRGVEGDARAFTAQVLDEVEQSVGVEHVSLAVETLGARGAELSSVEKRNRTPLERQIGPAERQRRVGDIGAANIEQPRQIMGIADQQALRNPDGLTHAGDLRAHAFAGKCELVRRDRTERRGRPIRPDGVDRVRVDCNESRAGLLTGGRISRDGVGRVEAGIIS